MTTTDTALSPVAGREADEAPTMTVTPRIDLLETENEFRLMADLPGVPADAVDVRFEAGELTLLARRPADRRPAVAYHRTFRLTDSVAADKIAAELKNGVLTLQLPKVEAVKPRRIAVRG